MGALVFGTAAGSLASYGLICLLLVVALGHSTASLRGPLIDRRQWRQVYYYGGPLIVASLSWVVLAGFDRAALGVVQGEAAAGQYAATYLVAEAAISLPALVLRYAVFTSVVEAFERGDHSQARRLTWRAGDGVLLSAIPVIIVFAFAGGRVIELVGGTGFEVPSVIPTLIAIGIVFQRLASLESIEFQLALASRGLARAFVIAIGVAIPVTTVLVVLEGLRGAAAATLISYASFHLIIRRTSPSTANNYPRRRLAGATLATASIMAAGLISPWLSVVLGVCAWSAAAYSVTRR
jgi:O-antigen/teichoic acid export membrane protein